MRADDVRSRGRRGRCGLVAVLAAGALLVLPASAAQAVHLFPLTPVFDPLGHDCARSLQAAPEAPSEGNAAVAGFSFVDRETRSSVTSISAGESVSWEWLLDHCHSVTFSDSRITGTAGGPGFQPAQPQLVRRNGDDATFTATFEEPGTYQYLCVHHASVGMRGTVEVAPAP